MSKKSLPILGGVTSYGGWIRGGLLVMNITMTFDKAGKDNVTRSISYMDYYKEKYNVTITDPKQPMLISILKDRDRRGGMKEPISLIPELCQVTGQSDEIRANFRLQEAIQHLTRRDPPSRAQNILDFAGRLSIPEVKKLAADFDVKIGTHLVDLDARVLPQEQIILRNNQMASIKDFSFAWAIIFPQRDQDKVKAFYESIKKVAVGIRFSPPKLLPIANDRNVGSYLSTINEITPFNPDFLLVVVPDDRSDRYGAIKKLLLLQNSINNQVVTVKKCMNNERRMMSIATKVYIQMQCKIGSEAWRTNFSTPGIMVVGFDVYHDTTRKNTSVGAMVASVNPELTRYYTTTLSHKDNTELSTQIATMLVECLRAYQTRNKSLPSRIIFYRDGVGEGNVYQVKEDELKKLTHLTTTGPVPSRSQPPFNTPTRLPSSLVNIFIPKILLSTSKMNYGICKMA
ncbi:Protein piwilike [Caligus rogercresseyi]|uniref:Protein piwilike n=1 Tax=Caligus rogercresseyi TaxID=217165 RepID=A0A7T8KHL9_CALRO|nr:Protein piwilike [Caligus rogercresseyi]